MGTKVEGKRTGANDGTQRQGRVQEYDKDVPMGETRDEGTENLRSRRERMKKICEAKKKHVV